MVKRSNVEPIFHVVSVFRKNSPAVVSPFTGGVKTRTLLGPNPMPRQLRIVVTNRMQRRSTVPIRPRLTYTPAVQNQKDAGRYAKLQDRVDAHAGDHAAQPTDECRVAVAVVLQFVIEPRQTGDLSDRVEHTGEAVEKRFGLRE